MLAIDENVLPGTRKANESRVQKSVQIITRKGPVSQLGATHGPAVDRKVDAGFPVDRADDVVFDLVQSELFASCREFQTMKKTVEKHDVFYTGHGIGIDHTAEDEGVVRVYPVCQFVAAGGKAVRMAVRTGQGQAVGVRIQRISRRLERGVCDAPQIIDMTAENLVEQSVVKGSGVNGRSDEEEKQELVGKDAHFIYLRTRNGIQLFRRVAARFGMREQMIASPERISRVMCSSIHI